MKVLRTGGTNIKMSRRYFTKKKRINIYPKPVITKVREAPDDRTLGRWQRLSRSYSRAEEEAYNKGTRSLYAVVLSVSFWGIVFIVCKLIIICTPVEQFLPLMGIRRQHNLDFPFFIKRLERERLIKEDYLTDYFDDRTLYPETLKLKKDIISTTSIDELKGMSKG
eukprot:TRINITY_DN27580_c0_g1_i1.p1 TRINITY_DN27580_c0_g1~~TRINITY_DN27580_c0_g1_i1.p1  ORF type:complete len:186 (+),score=13.90 TRINITY_DN27580_c0_g1_i1:63-560(+)